MRRLFLVVALVALACGGDVAAPLPQDPPVKDPFAVTATLSAAWASTGNCGFAWTAQATDAVRSVDYALDLEGQSFATGSFVGAVSQSWETPRAAASSSVAFTFSSGAFSSSGALSGGCT